jgi:hypothetical protein
MLRRGRGEVDAMNRALACWLAIVIPTWIVLVLCNHWEPITHDGWGHYFWHHKFELTLDNLWDFAHGSYVHNNPRIGQVLTLLLFASNTVHVIITPLVELALFYLACALVLGRWPSWRRSDDAVLFLLVLAMVATIAPVFGPMLFYLPYTGNYLYGLAISFAFLIP